MNGGWNLNIPQQAEPRSFFGGTPVNTQSNATPNNDFSNFFNWGKPNPVGNAPVDTGSFFGHQPIVPPPETGGMFANWNMGDVSKGLTGLGGILQGWSGIKGIQLGEDQLDFQKDFANRNLYNQAQTVNAELGDRQQRRISASGADNYQAVDEYVKQHGVKGSSL